MDIELPSPEMKKRECPACKGAGRYIAHRPDCTDSNCQIQGGAASCGGIMIECHVCVGSGISPPWVDEIMAVAK